MRQLPVGAGKNLLVKLWQWVLQPDDHSCSEKEEMARMGFILGRPLRESVQLEGAEQMIGRSERPDLLECIMDLWLTVELYLQRLWKLRGSIVAAPSEVQRTMRTHAASPLDVQGLIQNPYYARNQQGKKNHWLSSLAKFCQHRRHLEPIEDEPEEDKMKEKEQSVSKWDPEWTRWLTRHSAFGKPQRKPKAPKGKVKRSRKKKEKGKRK